MNLGDLIPLRLPKKRRRLEVVRRKLGRRDKNEIGGINDRAAYWGERMRLIWRQADRFDSVRDGDTALLRKLASMRGSEA